LSNLKHFIFCLSALTNRLLWGYH